jgi:hypothetical protein
MSRTSVQFLMLVNLTKFFLVLANVLESTPCLSLDSLAGDVHLDCNFSVDKHVRAWSLYVSLLSLDIHLLLPTAVAELVAAAPLSSDLDNTSNFIFQKAKQHQTLRNLTALSGCYFIHCLPPKLRGNMLTVLSYAVRQMAIKHGILWASHQGTVRCITDVFDHAASCRQTLRRCYSALINSAHSTPACSLSADCSVRKFDIRLMRLHYLQLLTF